MLAAVGEEVDGVLMLYCTILLLFYSRKWVEMDYFYKIFFILMKFNNFLLITPNPSLNSPNSEKAPAPQSN